MSKTTNKFQFDLMLNAMQSHPDIARGFFKGNREELTRFWRNLEVELNSAGPPSKSVSEWKKVWADKKKYVRHKAAQNLKASKATGGGPNAEQHFSATEDAIYKLIAMQESVEGVATTFGLGCSTSKNRVPETPEKAVEEFLLPDVAEDALENEIQPPPKRQQIEHRQLRPKKSSAAADVLAEELDIQNEICQAMKDQQQNTKKIYRSIERLYDLKKDELAELKRHNIEMEKLRLREVNDKIEKNRRLIELEELKARL